MIAPYLTQKTWLHRVGAGHKLLALAVISLGFTQLYDGRGLLVATLAVLAFYLVTIFGHWSRLRLYAPLVPLLIGIGALQAYASGWELAIASIARLVAMILLADLVTATTPMLKMMDALAPVLRPLRRIGVDENQVSLAVALVIRFMPVLLNEWTKRGEAWRARTGRRPPLRLLAPFVADILRLADHVAEALDSRGFSTKRSKD
ncbi:energy-coupling factor transporter transmembrane protein EcfT [Roseiarcaceae bacterium H3SJ34-1]|uniref:energy-coupling factor transporter transmembrane component T family protein n=1 Tax=Terripilifer ovatus TaxID=3032367 RepID=UPI003AB996BE|nr:energy-coupling factor transporter transmembrane protein EcfT [Roseiarcaceae bacterium H3SJ34-1]